MVYLSSAFISPANRLLFFFNGRVKAHIIRANYNISLKLHLSATMLLVGSSFTNMDLAQCMVLT